MLGLMCSPQLNSVELAVGEGVVTDKLCLTKRNCEALVADPDLWSYSP